MSNVVGVISTCRPPGLLEGLTRERPIAAVPFGARYRLLDFTLSNMVNSGIRTVGIIVPYNCRPVLDHLKAGKGWSLDRKMGGLFILPCDEMSGGSQGFLLKDLSSNIDFFKKTGAEEVILACSEMVFNTTYTEALRHHISQNADVTLIYHEGKIVTDRDVDSVFLEVGAGGKVTGFSKGSPWQEEGRDKVFLDTVIIKRELLLALIRGFASAGDDRDLLTMIMESPGTIRIYAYPFDGYVGRIDSVQSYFNCSMDLLSPDIRKELFNSVHTKIADRPPSRYGVTARVRNSLIAGGCRIEGRVENSIIFRDVYVRHGALIKNSIIMQKCFVGRDVRLEYAILDKFAQVKQGVVIEGEEHNPSIIEKRVKLRVKGVVL